MKERNIELVMLLVTRLKLRRRTAELLATALIVVSRRGDDWSAAKTIGILMGYNAAGLIDEDTYQAAHDLVQKAHEAKTEDEALDIIFGYLEKR